MTPEPLIIRKPSPADLADFLAYRNAPESMSLQPIEPMAEDAALRFLTAQATLDPVEATGWIMFAIELEEERKMIGEVGIYIPKDAYLGDVGWSIHPSFQGRGYATQAAKSLLRFAFETRGLHRITATCDSRNAASVRMMEKLGMRREATFLKSRFINQEWRDECVFAMLQEEWRATSGEPV